ncbi:non-ribosomal peptide synthetase [Nostoc sp. WHI]|uniref:non-ribosomal peptide synthetase n=1 Tax=Nostoc sp. WHI TaxID=2650611 RepID=UPI0018C6C48C|nr:non-ribosomal peptide synthetase [Nostoc sp. WHI]MBG1270226.1 amino acid adenylation domain-containing protein [Nostoc sp. WHI]
MQETLEGYQLSPQQKYLWQLQQIDNPQTYRIQLAVMIQGNLNRKILKVAIEQVVNRHEILRTNFKTLPGLTIPLQIIGEGNISWHSELDLSQLSLQARQTKVDEVFQQLKVKSFNFEQGSLLHISLLLLSANQQIMLLCLPALCSDVTSVQNLVDEISRSYRACLQSEEIAKEPLQYVDIAEWQNELLTTADGEIGKTYWQQQNVSIGINVKLAWEKEIIKFKEYQPQIISIKMNPTLEESINKFVEKHEFSLEKLLLACWQTLLWRLTGNAEFIIGTAFDGRRYQDLQPSIGLLTKYLPFQVKLDNKQTISQVTQQIIDNSREANQWQEYYHWEQIKNFNEQSVFQPLPFGFDFYQISIEQVSKNIIWSISQINFYLDKFKLNLSCIYKDDLQLDFYYDAHLFTAENIQSLAAQFERLLESAIANPDMSISQLDILTARERQQLLYGFNNTQTDFERDKLIHQLFEAEVESYPNHIAVVYESQQLTYTELNQRANQLAHYLQQLGVKPETVVAICLERSLEAIIAILGILKAGGAYLPLDPNFPTASLIERLQDAQAQVLLTNSAIQQQHSALSTPIVLCLDTAEEKITSQSHENLLSNVTTENLAYIIYTSGSTGKPKGITIEHQQILNYLHSIQQRLKLPTGASFALVSTLAADLGNTAIFPALCSGGCLHIISGECATNGQALADYCRQHPIDCLKIVPSHLEVLLTSPSTSDLLPKARLILGGETCSWELIKKVQQFAPDCMIFNHYGPTETTVGVLTYRVEQIDLSSQTVPLGKAIANTQVYVLDSQLQVVPIGVPGELYIGGAGLARGYINQPELTAEKFIDNPFDKLRSPRLYKTGDLARYLPNGNIEYLGRIDHQVKIRGFRVELGEIEAVLSRHPAIYNSVVVAHEDESGNQHLIGYVVPNSKLEIPKSSNLRDFLKQKLPDYMVPAVFVMLKTLPITSNGKVDRKALPAPEQVRPELEATFVPPRTEVEQMVAVIWSEVLGLEKIGIHDNFFDLGGHSLLLTQVTSRLYNAFGLELSLRQMLATPTIAELAIIIAEKQLEQADNELLEQMLAELEQMPEDQIPSILSAENIGVAELRDEILSIEI